MTSPASAAIGAENRNLARSNVQTSNRGVNKTAEQLVDMLFAGLKLVFPAAISTTLKDPRDEAAAKRQWIFSL